MKKMIALLTALTLALALGGCKPATEPETAAVETAAESGSMVMQDSGSEAQSAPVILEAASDEAQDAESGVDEAEVQEDTFEDE